MSVNKIDSRGTHGYQARVYLAPGVPRVTKFFAAARHGGWREAYRKALAFEVEVLKAKSAGTKKRGVK